MTEHPFAERLSDYVDGGLESGQSTEIEAHLRACSRCRETVGELRALKREARSLPRQDPPATVWDAVRLEIGGVGQNANRPGGATFVWTYLYPGLALAAVVLLGVSLWLVRPDGGDGGPEDAAALAGIVTEELRQAESHYENAIEGLERILERNDGALPPELSSVLNENLDLIEQAIAESRSALSDEPQSTVAQESFLEALRRKVSLLQSTILLINEVRKGEGENALDLIDQIRRAPASSNPI